MLDPSRISAGLPEDIRNTIDQIVVDRCGDDPQSYMRTEDIIGFVAPGARYRIEADRLSRVSGAARSQSTPAAPAAPPPHVRLRGVWNATEDIGSSAANVFGGLGTLTLSQSDFDVPEAPSTESALAYYGVRIYQHGDIVEFAASQNMPVTVTRYGPAYASGFLHVDGLGGGSFIEHHVPPHLHMPLDPSASGHLVLGRSDGDDYQLSAFRIPYGSAIYISANVLHADPYLVGRYMVVYAATDDYSTVVFRSRDGRLVNPRVG